MKPRRVRLAGRLRELYENPTSDVLAIVPIIFGRLEMFRRGHPDAHMQKTDFWDTWPRGKIPVVSLYLMPSKDPDGTEVITAVDAWWYP